MATLQTLFTNKKQGFSCEITIPQDFQAEFDALTPRMAYCAAYGFGQSTIDGIAGMKDQAAFEGKIMKKSDAIFAGTVRVAGSGERTPTKTPMEREVWKIAALDLAELFTKKKVPKDKQAVYVRMKVERDWDELVEQARINLEKVETIKPDAFAALDELYAEDESDEEESDEEDDES
ncbi:MAG: hypothetical protein DMF62_03600 [Acidobacteria bacterium]|nr:MAG: hypothetical protein DMF62_03600 [Acidobacteriota bacterium]